MFDRLQEKLSEVVSRLRGRGKISDKDLDAALRELRIVLLEADVHFKVAKDFIARVKEAALGRQVLESLSPEQMILKIFHEELTALMGGPGEKPPEEVLDLHGRPPVVIMFVGLQGTGKTTSIGKLARWMKEKLKRSPAVISLDVYRPAAIEQLAVLARDLGVPHYPTDPNDKPTAVAPRALDWAAKEGADVLIVDTAGRLAIDEPLMEELEALKKTLQPREILYCLDVMAGQDALTTAETFHQRLAFTGLVLTKLDGDARGGAALSARAVTGVPVKFVGMGEKVAAFEVFHAERMASRILDLGDMSTLLERAQENIAEDDAEGLAEKFQKGKGLDLEDFRKQLKMLSKLGSLESILKLVPGMGKITRQLGNMAPAEKEMKRIEAILGSMTVFERRNPKVFNASRKRRVASGSGTSVQEINRLLHQFMEAQTMMKQFQRLGLKGLKGKGLPF